MLTALLPGIRGIRSALVAGYMWVGAVWLLILHFSPPNRPPMLSEPIVQLLDFFGTGGKLVIVSTLCLLVGEVASNIVHSICFDLANRSLNEVTPATLTARRKGWQRTFFPMSRPSLYRLYRKILREHRETDPDAAEYLAIDAVREVLFIPPRLIVAKPELYNEYDRVKSESEFRDAILLPMPILAFAVCLHLNTPVLVKVAIMIMVVGLDGYLFRQSRRQFRTAHSMVAHSVADGTIISAALDRTHPKPL